MLSPKRTKYRKYHRGRMRGKATRGNEVSFGKYGLQALEPSWITSRQIEATRRTITRYTKRGASLWIRISRIKLLPHEPLNHVWDQVRVQLIIGLQQ